MKCLTIDEQQERRYKGLCLTVTNDFILVIDSKKKKLLLLLSDDTTNTTNESEIEIEQEILKENSHLLLTGVQYPTCENLHLSQAALKGPPSSKTLRVKGLK